MRVQVEDEVHIISARLVERGTAVREVPGGAIMTDEIPELSAATMARALRASVRRRLVAGDIRSGKDVASFWRFVELTQVEFARALGISVSTLRNWEQGRRHPEGPAIALLRIAARHPRIIRENIGRAA